MVVNLGSTLLFYNYAPQWYGGKLYAHTKNAWVVARIGKLLTDAVPSSAANGHEGYYIVRALELEWSSWGYIAYHRVGAPFCRLDPDGLAVNVVTTGGLLGQNIVCSERFVEDGGWGGYFYNIAHFHEPPPYAVECTQSRDAEALRAEAAAAAAAELSAARATNGSARKRKKK